MRLLILGGTIFYGRHVTEEAMRRGHDVTLFTRGLHNVDLFDGATRLSGDRDGGLAALENGTWDAILDTCGYVPRVVRQSAELLSGRANVYAFVSSISVFTGEGELPIREDSPRGTLDDPSYEVVEGATYGPLKALCEDVVNEVWGERALVTRPGLIVGPYDSSDRFSYWPWRFHRGGDVVVPDRPGQAVQIIDARDLANWTLDMLERGRGGTYNATGPSEPYRLGDIFDRLRGTANPISIPCPFLAEQGAQFWTEIPLSHGDESDALMRCDVSRAVAAGLGFRALEETAQDTLNYVLERGPEYPWRNGLPEAKEARILAAWREKSKFE